MERIPIGVQALDESLKGGLPRGSISMVLGPPGSGKSILGRLYLYQGLLEPRPAILVSTSESMETVRNTIESFSWRISAFDKLLFLDCYSWQSGEKASRYSANISSLTDVSIGLTSIIDDFKLQKDQRIRLVVDSFTDLIKYGGSDAAMKFIDSLRIRLRHSQITSLIMLEAGVHDERVVTAIEYSTDGTIRMKFSEEGRYMMISRMTATPLDLRWIPFSIG
ncbi:MAG: RAD55 family ATPase [Nitrososphaerales archaeon]|jgi:KaiC/GvpD/RAD55 family RecA-like ATPase|nr:hypothetical protein [Nitrososphaerota archaeon]